MRYVKYYYGTQYCGTTEEKIYCYGDNITNSEIEKEGEFLCRENAEKYEYLVDTELIEDECDTEEEILSQYYANTWMEWEDSSREEYKEYLRNSAFQRYFFYLYLDL